MDVPFSEALINGILNGLSLLMPFICSLGLRSLLKYVKYYTNLDIYQPNGEQ